MDLERFAPDTRHMIVFDVLSHDSPIGWKGQKDLEVYIKINGQAVSVEVTIEVYEFLDLSRRKSENLAHKNAAIGMGGSLMKSPP